MSSRLLILTLLVTLIAAQGCAIKREDPKELAAAVSRDVATVGQVSQGTNGAPIIILEEQHTSRAAQLQEAVVLNRLFNDHKVKHIGLEGYIKEQPTLNSDWFSKAARDAQAARPVAVSLLREGEISSAEFMKLIDGTTGLIPIETRSEFDLQEPDGREVFFVCIDIIYRTALKSLRPEQEAKLDEIIRKADDHKSDPAARKKKMQEAMFKYIYSTDPTVLSADPWVSETMSVFKKPESLFIMSLEKEVALYEGIQKHAREKAVPLQADEQLTLDSYVTFLQKRMAASKTMADAIAPVADQNDTYAVAIIVGAAHTEGICKLLKDAGRPFAVVRPMALDAKEDVSVIPSKMFLNKYKGGSVYSGGFTKMLLDSFPASAGHHPPPVVQQQWFEAKSELYLYTERISHDLFGGGGKGTVPPAPPGGAGSGPPYGFGDNDFRGSFIYIDPKKIKIVPDGKNGKGLAAVFPVEMNPNDPLRHKTIWAKAARVGEEVPPSSEKEAVEAMLKDALHEVEEDNLSKARKSEEKMADEKEVAKEKEVANEKEATKENTANKNKGGTEPDPAALRVEDEVGRVKVTRETMASYAPSEDAIMRTVIGGQ